MQFHVVKGQFPTLKSVPCNRTLCLDQEERQKYRLNYYQKGDKPRSSSHLFGLNVHQYTSHVQDYRQKTENPETRAQSEENSSDYVTAAEPKAEEKEEETNCQEQGAMAPKAKQTVMMAAKVIPKGGQSYPRNGSESKSALQPNRRNFLQVNRALTDHDLHNSSITVPVTKTFLPRQMLKEKTPVATLVDKVPSPKLIESKCRVLPRNQKKRENDFYRPLLVLMLILTYLVTASYTPENSDPVIHKLPKFLVHGVPDHVTEDTHVVCTTVTQLQVKRTESDQREVLKRRETDTMKLLQSSDAYKALKSNYSSPLTVEQDLQEDKRRDVFDAINAHIGNEGLRY